MSWFLIGLVTLAVSCCFFAVEILQSEGHMTRGVVISFVFVVLSVLLMILTPLVIAIFPQDLSVEWFIGSDIS